MQIFDPGDEHDIARRRRVDRHAGKARESQDLAHLAAHAFGRAEQRHHVLAGSDPSAANAPDA